MWLFDPQKFSVSPKGWLQENGYMDVQKARMQFALANAEQLPKPSDVTAVIEYLGDEAGIHLSQDEFSKILSLYPIQRGKLAAYGFSDTEVREQMLSVIANFMANTRWPDGGDGVKIDNYLSNLRLAARLMGYKTDEELVGEQ